MNILPFALTAGVVGAVIEYPLGKKFPLRDPVSIATRMFVTGALVTGSVLVAGALSKRKREEKAKSELNDMKDLIDATRSSLSMSDCKTALSNAGKAAVAAGHVETYLDSMGSEFKSTFSTYNRSRMDSRDELSELCFK